MPNPAVIVDFLANTKGLQKGVKDVERSTSSFGGSLKKLGKTAAITGGAAGIGALAIGAKVAITAASDLNESINAVKVTFGTASKQVLDFSEKAAKQAGLSMREFNQLVTPVGAGLRNAGYSADEAAKASIELTKRAADMASVFNTSVPEALEAIQSGLRGEADPLEKFGVGLSDAAVKAKAMAMGLADTEKALTAQDKAQARIALLMQQSSRYAGDFVNTSDSLANQQRILRAEFENVAATVGNVLLPILTDAIAWLRKHWPEIAAVITKAWEDSIEPTLVALGELFASVATLVEENWGTIGPIVEGVVSVIQAQLKIVIGIVKLFAALLRGDWSAAWGALKGIAEAGLDAVKAVLKLYAAVGGALVKAAVAIGKAILEGVQDGLVGIGEAAWKVIDNIGAWIANKATDIGNWGKSVASGIKNGVTGALVGIGEAAWKVIDNIGTWITDKAGTIKEWGAKIGNGIVGGVKAAFEGLGNVLAAILKGALNTLIRGWNDLEIPGFKVKGPGPLPDINFPAVKFPDIPLLARGGIVTGPTLAMLGEAGPEAVLPLGANSAPIEVRVFIGDTELKGIVRAEVRQADTRTAQVLLAGGHGYS